jgi:serine/threonine protein kinase
MVASRTDHLLRAKTRLGTLLKDKFRLEAVLGVGGMATVYSATHRNGKRVAVKLLHPQFAADPELVTRFLREGYVANKIEHPGCVNVLDDDSDGDMVFLVMELLEGYSLERFTRPAGSRMPLAQVLQVADETLDVLAVAHAKGITHRDIKPANLFLTNEGKTKVLDFGIARLADGGIDGSATQTGVAIGTPAFMPPEQARGRKHEIDARTDVWSLGATMLALLAGDRPRRAETGAEELLLAMTAPMPPLLERVPSVPPSIAAVVDRALAFDREARWPDARSMQMALRDARHSGVEVPREPTGPRVDTAPVLVASSPLGPDPTTQLGTGSTLVGQRTGGAPAGRHALAAAFLASFVGALTIATVVWVAITRHAPSAPVGVAAAPPPATTTTLPPTPSSMPEPSASAHATVAQPAASGPPSVDVADLPGATSPVAKTPPLQGRPATARPSPPPGTATPPANPLDKRF